MPDFAITTHMSAVFLHQQELEATTSMISNLACMGF
jgi:hypothetical protein